MKLYTIWNNIQYSLNRQKNDILMTLSEVKNEENKSTDVSIVVR